MLYTKKIKAHLWVATYGTTAAAHLYPGRTRQQAIHNLKRATRALVEALIASEGGMAFACNTVIHENGR